MVVEEWGFLEDVATGAEVVVGLGEEEGMTTIEVEATAGRLAGGGAEDGGRGAAGEGEGAGRAADEATGRLAIVRR